MYKKKTGYARALSVLIVTAPLLFLSGCGTLNILPFPYQSAAKAADKVLDDIIPAQGATESPRQVSEAKKP